MTAIPGLGFLRTRRGQLAAGVVVCVVGAAVGILVVSGGGSSKTVTADNVSRNYRVCLMNDASDTADANTTQAAWAGLEKAAASGHVNAERLMLGGTTPAAAAPYINGAVLQHCGLIVAIGGRMESAISHSATSNAHQEFLLVGGSSTQSNVRTITAATPANVTSSTYSLVMGLSQS
jgi:basic membrane lipoprotein Med (substrate-binding protein (PBP1-ABC) superfamily)